MTFCEMRILAVDPGLTSGIALLREGDSTPDSWELAADHAVDLCDGLLNGQAQSIVACELFVPRPGIRTWQPDALEITGVLRHLCRWHGHDFKQQTPADAKRFATDSKLKRLGWYTPSKGGHANDALRHLMLAAVRHGEVRLSELQDRA